jgi:hypothetical protein
MTRTASTSSFIIAIATLCTLATTSIVNALGAPHAPHAQRAQRAQRAQQTSSGASAAPTTATTTATATSVDTRWDRFAGDWRAESDGTELVKTAIERATQEMSMFTRGVARGRLRERNAPPASIRMSRQGDLFTIRFAGAEPVSLPISGTPVQVGDRTIRIQPQPDGDGLRHEGKNPDGARENIFRLDSADRMTMAVTVSSPRLPAPVTYTLAFTRAR